MTVKYCKPALLTFLFLAFALVGCEGESLSEENPESSEVSAEQLEAFYDQDQEFQSRFASGIPDHVDTAELSNSAKATRNVAEELFSFRRLAKDAGTWKEAHEAIQTELSASSSVPQFVREQMAGSVMLNEWLNEGELTSEKQDALGLYTRLMVKNQSPQAVEVRTALERLEGHWSPDQIATAAQTVAASAQSHFGVDLDRGKASSTGDASDEGHAHGLAEAVRGLMAMSQQG